ncbi:MAG: ECF-type sigma factor [Gemmatimonadaceae bacterium]
MQSNHTDISELGAPRAALDRLVPQLYDELLAVAGRQLGREYGPRSIQPATLVHEAYLRLARHVPAQLDRTQILALAAHSMRQVLVDRARERNAEKRGGEWARVTLTDGVATTEIEPTAFLALNDAIERLDPRQRQVVECRFFAGLDEVETATALGVTRRTVQRDWIKARAWLGRWLHENNAQ